MARLRPARAYQHPRAPLRQIARYGQGAIMRSMREAMRHMPSMLHDRKLRFYLRTHPRQAGDAFDWHHFREIMKAPHDKIARVYEAGAHLAVRKINGAFAAKQRRVRFSKEGTSEDANSRPGVGEREVLSLRRAAPSEASQALVEAIVILKGSIIKAVGDRFNFDRFTDDVQAHLRETQDELIQQLEQDVRDTIEAVTLRGQQLAMSPDDVADTIRDVISLTDRQAQAVMNYRLMLESLDPDALGRQLREEDYDAMFQRALDEGISLADATIDDMVSAYESNYLDYRAATIASTESVRAANLGMQDAYAQAIDRGALPAGAVKQFWQVSLTENTCPICLSIPDMNPDGVAIDEDFDSIDGPQGAPPDPHPNCNCSLEIVTDLDLVPDEPFEP